MEQPIQNERQTRKVNIKKPSKEEKKKPNWIFLIAIVLFVIYLLGLTLDFSPESYMGSNALSQLKKGIHKDFLLLLPIVGIIAAVGVWWFVGGEISRAKQDEQTAAYVKRIEERMGSPVEVQRDKKGLVKEIVIFCAAAVIFMWLVIDLSVGFYRYTRSDYGGLIDEIGVCRRINKDEKAKETVTAEYTKAKVEISTVSVRSVMGESDGEYSKYVLKCTGDYGGCDFLISKNDAQTLKNVLENVDDKDNNVIKVEYYKNSYVIKTLSINGVIMAS